MNYRVKFINNSGRRVQLTVVSNSTENFQIFPGDSDDSTLMPEGSDFTFYWRDDGAQCRVCQEPDCNPYTQTMPGSDLAIPLPDPNGRWPKQTI